MEAINNYNHDFRNKYNVNQYNYEESGDFTTSQQ